MKDKRNSLRKSTLPRLHYGSMLYKLIFFSSNMLALQQVTAFLVISVQTLFKQGRIALQASGQILTLWGYFAWNRKPQGAEKQRKMTAPKKQLLLLHYILPVNPRTQRLSNEQAQRKDDHNPR